MNSAKKLLMQIDGILESFEKHFCGCGILILTVMMLVAVVARFCFKYAFPWLEELAQYLMVWVVCMGAALSTKGNEHVAVDSIFTILPKRFHPFYRIILVVVSIVFLIIFSFYSWKTTMMIRRNGQFSVTMPWLKMYWLYGGVTLGLVLMCYEFIKLCYSMIKGGWKPQEDTPLEKLEKA